MPGPISQNPDSRLREPGVTLCDGNVFLRPMAEGDWGRAFPIHVDPDVGSLFERGDSSIDDLQRRYRPQSQGGFLFVIELGGRPIGDCGLRKTERPPLLDRYPSLDLREIDLAIADKGLWLSGAAVRAVHLLVELAFQREGADAIFACDITGAAVRSALQHAGFELFRARQEPSGGIVSRKDDMVIRRLAWRGFSPAAPGGNRASSDAPMD